MFYIDGNYIVMASFNLIIRIPYRVPYYTAETLTTWFKSTVPGQTSRVIDYFMDRTAMVLEILDEADVITKNAYVNFTGSSPLSVC
jgi:hypothetical protein